MYNVTANNKVIATFDTVLEALAYCVKHHWLIFNGNGGFSPLEIQ